VPSECGVADASASNHGLGEKTFCRIELGSADCRTCMVMTGATSTGVGAVRTWRKCGTLPAALCSKQWDASEDKVESVSARLLSEIWRYQSYRLYGRDGRNLTVLDGPRPSRPPSVQVVKKTGNGTGTATVVRCRPAREVRVRRASLEICNVTTNQHQS
jgi:hypothetical protein